MCWSKVDISFKRKDFIIKKTNKKIISLVLACVMILSITIMPIAAYEEETEYPTYFSIDRWGVQLSGDNWHTNSTALCVSRVESYSYSMPRRIRIYTRTIATFQDGSHLVADMDAPALYNTHDPNFNDETYYGQKFAYGNCYCTAPTGKVISQSGGYSEYIWTDAEDNLLDIYNTPLGTPCTCENHGMPLSDIFGD